MEYFTNRGLLIRFAFLKDDHGFLIQNGLEKGKSGRSSWGAGFARAVQAGDDDWQRRDGNRWMESRGLLQVKKTDELDGVRHDGGTLPVRLLP